MYRGARISVLVIAAFLFSSGPLFAQYTLVLKNGRRITVQSYREEGGMIKFQGLGGEIGISRDQVQSIVKAGEREGRGLVVPRSEASAPPPFVETKVEEKREKAAEIREADGKGTEKALTPEEMAAAEKAKEEKSYQERVKQLTEQLKAARDRYFLATRGSTSTDPTLLHGDEAIKARTDDLTSRMRDVQHNPGGPGDAGGVKLLTPSPFSGAPPTAPEHRPGEESRRVDTPRSGYSGKERELSDLRNQISQLEKQRERVIEEMRLKNFNTGSLFLE